MTVQTNYVVPSSFFKPPIGSGRLIYLTKHFENEDPDDLSTDVNAWFISLIATDGRPWPHIVHTHYLFTPKAGNIDAKYHMQIVYMLVG